MGDGENSAATVGSGGSRRRSIGGFSDVSNRISGKTTSGRRTSLNAGQIVNTFRMIKRKVAFDPGRIEYGFYDSEEDDEYNPPIINRSEIAVRRVESSVDLVEVEGKTFSALARHRRKRTLTFPSNDIDTWKAVKILELST